MFISQIPSGIRPSGWVPEESEGSLDRPGHITGIYLQPLLWYGRSLLQAGINVRDDHGKTVADYSLESETTSGTAETS
jgi:hypothetical protein